ncbi:hypothetical protein GCM10010261_64200 [Streptomyces pilosus]|nr:hypothetical protein GCM10010261_64200 [Streptomyces pilosus]
MERPRRRVLAGDGAPHRVTVRNPEPDRSHEPARRVSGSAIAAGHSACVGSWVTPTRIGVTGHDVVRDRTEVTQADAAEKQGASAGIGRVACEPCRVLSQTRWGLSVTPSAP